jgi:FHA domain
MDSTISILDLSAWASELAPVFRRALDPATSVKDHRGLAEQASECLEQGALLGDRAADAETPWRALLAGDECFLALEAGFVLARFDASNLIRLRVDTYDGRRWLVVHTGRGLASFRQAALGRGPGTGENPVLKVSGFADRRMLFSHVFHPDGQETEELGFQGPLGNLPPAKGGQGLAEPVEFGPGLLRAGAVLMRRAVESLKATREVPEPVAPPPLPRAEPPAGAGRPAVPDPSPVPAGSGIPRAPGSPAEAPPAAPRRNWRLVALTGDQAGQIIPVPGLAVVGRDQSADIPIENLTVSRRHAELRPTDLGMVVKDLGSANGTWFDRKQLIGPVLLKSGETFTLGECVFRVERL